MQRPLVSIIIPTYKRPQMLKRAIDSVLSQTYEAIEAIVVDDNDPETTARKETEAVLSQVKSDRRVRYIQHTRNMNGSAARNTGIKMAQGDYIAFLDDDDEFMPSKVELQVKRLQELDGSWGACYTHYIRKSNRRYLDRGIERREGVLTTDILEGNLYISAGSNLLVRKEVVDRMGGFNEDFKRRQDLEFLVRLSQVTKIACVPEVCFIEHKDDRSNVLGSEELLLKNTQDFIELFRDYIDALPDEQRRKIVVGQSLGLVRFNILKGRLWRVLELCRSNGISLFTLTRYVLYLLNRRIRKLCYGFRV